MSRVVRALSFHANYACENSGVCCSSGWPIAVEERVELTVRSRTARHPNGPHGFVPESDLTPGCRSVFRSTAAGACWFRDDRERTCSIHREFGEAALASACRHFPRVSTIEPDAVLVSLSHYCPTAAGLLFRADQPFEITDNPRAFPATWPFEGLDAQQSYSPFLRPGVLLGYDGLRALESVILVALSGPDIFQAIQRVRRVIDQAHAWTPSAGGLADLISRTRADEVEEFVPRDPRAVLNASLTQGTRVKEGLPEWNGRVEPVSDVVDLALRRYVAARFFGNWITFLADDLMTTAAYLDLCLNTTLLFAGAQRADEPEISRWKEAIRSADLWLMHHCDPDLIARNLR